MHENDITGHDHVQSVETQPPAQLQLYSSPTDGMFGSAFMFLGKLNELNRSSFFPILITVRLLRFAIIRMGAFVVSTIVAGGPAACRLHEVWLTK